jgi:hypothetical protein
VTHYYVYYRIAPEQVVALRGRVQAMFKTLESQCGVRGRWMHRRDDPSTYMEVYEGVLDAVAFEALLEHEGAKLGLQRKLERFVNAT